MNKFITAIQLIMLSAFVLVASNVTGGTLDHLSSTDRDLLYSNGEISRYFFNNDKPEYMFETTFKKDLMDEISKLNIKIGVESLYFLKNSDLHNRDNITPLSIYNTLLSIKTMKGIEYYSESRKKMRTLFTESHGIVSMDDPNPIPDPVLETIPFNLSRYILQTDKTFGENIYEVTYNSDGYTTWVNMINMTKMNYLFITMLKPEKMSINLFVIPVKDGLLFYGVCAVETLPLLGLEKSKKESFYNRIKAMYNWFANQIVTE